MDIADRNVHKNACVLLRDAKKLIADPEHWAIGVEARDGEGNPVVTLSSEAYAFCSIGALVKVSNQTFNDSYDLALYFLAESARKWFGARNFSEDTEEVSVFNDSDDVEHDDVIWAFDDAIERIKGVIEDGYQVS